MPAPDGIPAIFLIKTRRLIGKPMMLLLTQSLDDTSIVEVYKIAYESPIHKGGSKLLLRKYNKM